MAQHIGGLAGIAASYFVGFVGAYYIRAKWWSMLLIGIGGLGCLCSMIIVGSRIPIFGIR